MTAAGSCGINHKSAKIRTRLRLINAGTLYVHMSICGHAAFCSRPVSVTVALYAAANRVFRFPTRGHAAFISRSAVCRAFSAVQARRFFSDMRRCFHYPRSCRRAGKALFRQYASVFHSPRFCRVLRFTSPTAAYRFRRFRGSGRTRRVRKGARAGRRGLRLSRQKSGICRRTCRGRT